MSEILSELHYYFHVYTRAKEKERELQRAFAEKERQLQETQLTVAKKLGEAEHKISSLHSALETAQSELFEVKSKYDEATSAKSDEMEMVMADLERANERAAQAERQTERLKQQLAVAAQGLERSPGAAGRDGDSSVPGGDGVGGSSATDQAMDILKRSTLEVELAAKEKEIAQLVEDVQRLQASLAKLRESTSAQVAKLEEELSSKNQAFRILEEKLQTQDDYEEVKRELRVLKSIEFCSSEGSSAGGSEDSVGKSLEVLLLEKNKALQGENTHLKVLNTGLADISNQGGIATDAIPTSPGSPSSALSTSSRSNITTSTSSTTKKPLNTSPPSAGAGGVSSLSPSSPLSLQNSTTTTIATTHTTTSSETSTTNCKDTSIGGNGTSPTALSSVPHSSHKQLTSADTSVSATKNSYISIKPSPSPSSIKREVSSPATSSISSTPRGTPSSLPPPLPLALLPHGSLLASANPNSSISTVSTSTDAAFTAAAVAAAAAAAAASSEAAALNFYHQHHLVQQHHQLQQQHHRSLVSTPTSSSSSHPRLSPSNNNHKMASPDVPPSPNAPPPTSPLAALTSTTSGHPLDPRHFGPPMSPFYGFPGSPFHPAFLPLNMVKAEAGLVQGLTGLSSSVSGGSSSNGRDNNATGGTSSTPGGLDTACVAKTVRELLSIHNIGQRLFAKHVLGLSQGTVSELLSKPKSWDKLTEKGRESYRKMHAWATDEANIMALKAISPKKGTQPLAPNNSYKEKEDSVTEERIANILNEAQVAMHMKKSLEQQQVANAVVSSIYHHELSKMGGVPAPSPHHPPGLGLMGSPTLPPSSLTNGPHFDRSSSRNTKGSTRGDGGRQSVESSSSSGGRHHHHSGSGGAAASAAAAAAAQDEASSAQEMVARIYRQELEKLKKSADAAGNVAASAMYAQELTRINSNNNNKSDSSSKNSSVGHGGENNNVPKSPSSPPVPSLSASSSLAASNRSNHIKQEHVQQQQQQQPFHLNSHLFMNSSPPPSLALPLSRPDSSEPVPLALDFRTNTTRPLNGICLKTEPVDSSNDNCGAIDLSKPSSQTASSTPRSSPTTSDSGVPTGSAFFPVKPRLNGHDASNIGSSPLSSSNISNKANMKAGGGGGGSAGASENDSAASNPATPSPSPHQQLQGNSAMPGAGGGAGGPRYGSVPPAECLSPLQRMQNIANSLNSRGGASGAGANTQAGAGSKPLRAVLPPITQEEFDRFANMNTDELVKKVKETLSQYSISQRLFGESVLGLSQGSVSDLLARPKPWHMLTQKGREPFIRMQLFLEDTDSIPKLVASQYRIPPDKLMRSNSRGSSEPDPSYEVPASPRSQSNNLPLHQTAQLLPPHLPPPPPPPPPPPSLTTQQHSSLSLSSTHSHNAALTPSLTGEAASPPPRSPSPSSPPSSSHSPSACLPPPSAYAPPFLHSPPIPSSPGSVMALAHHRFPPLHHFHGLQSPGALPLHEHFLSPGPGNLAQATTSSVGVLPPTSDPRGWGTPTSTVPPSSSATPSTPSTAPLSFPSSMLEVIAMTSEIDTLTLTSGVKDVLQFHNLGQKLFGEAVLGLSQGSVSELLSKPKPWHMLSIKGREPFIKMHLWLGDPQNVEHLKLYQSQMKAHRRRKSSADQNANSAAAAGDAQRASNGAGGGSGFDSPSQPKRPRVFFTEDQKDSLRRAYAQDPYPNQSTIEALARSLGVGVKTVINWFHNHRMRAKQQHHSGWERAGGAGGGEVGAGNVKSEPDESSNQSDMSSVSGDVGNQGGGASLPSALTANSNTGGGSQSLQAGGGGVTPADLNQWLFPKFEPMNLLRKVPNNIISGIGSGGMVAVGNDEDNKENNGGLPEDEDEIDEPDCLDTAPSNCINNNNNNEKEKGEESGSGESEDDSDNENSGEKTSRKRQRTEGGSLDTSSPSVSGAGLKPNPSSAGSGVVNNVTTTSGVNKRKRSQPQRVYEGAQLDRVDTLPSYSPGLPAALTVDTPAKFDTDEEGKAMLAGYANDDDHDEEEGAGEDDCPALAALSSNNNTTKILTTTEVTALSPGRDDHSVGADEVEEKVTTTGEGGEEEISKTRVDSPHSSIDKLQKNIESNSTDEDWEF
ncbi:homeobox protein cut-like 1 [Plakobranchus ocellatus]|uniref:Homeobox protein cut-like n=1 Tax=Plakobranchus ocellatus TaxID=259542 RepID=A0AAV4CFB2_9GAST|nr:homeobox protein cut-like 1 [Plakobranchus ocellatus]